MQTGYFKLAWNDIKTSPSWFGKVLLLSLISLIPIFGWIVVTGYLFGWARDVAWKVHTPLPQHIFDNKDGKLYSRGFFVIIIGLICSLLPWFAELIGFVLSGNAFGLFGYRATHVSAFPFAMVYGLMAQLSFALGLAANFFALIFYWVGSMRASIYGRLSAGLQFARLWSMIRHDFGGLMRILGMALILGAILGAICIVVFSVLGFFFLVAGAIAVGHGTLLGSGFSNFGIVGLILSVGFIGIILMLVVGYLVLVLCVFCGAMVVRALGYWTGQFEVAQWRGQDDPLPFEVTSPE